jgi:hypothetical protein
LTFARAAGAVVDNPASRLRTPAATTFAGAALQSVPNTMRSWGTVASRLGRPDGAVSATS